MLHDKFDGQVYHGNSCCMTVFMVRMLTAVLHDNFDGHSQRQHWTHLKKRLNYNSHGIGIVTRRWEDG